MGAKHSLGSPELSFRRPNSTDHLHSQHRGSSPHKPCSPSARATFSSQAREFLPEGSQKLWVRLLPSPEKHGLANLFCSVTLWHTHPWRSAHAPLSRFPSHTRQTVNLCLQEGNLLMFSLRSQKNHQVPGDKHCSLSKAARNGSHYSLREQCRHSEEIYSGHRGLMPKSKNNDNRTPCRGTAASELYLLHIRLKIQASSQNAFLLPPSAAVLLCCGSMDPALRNNFPLIHLFHLL